MTNIILCKLDFWVLGKWNGRLKGGVRLLALNKMKSLTSVDVMKVGFIGLGKMGSRMILKLLNDGHEVIAWNRSKEPMDELIKSLTPKEVQGFSPAESIENLIASLKKPAVLWLMLPAGEATQAVLDEVAKFIVKGDIVIDGGNAKHTDTQRRFDEFQKKGIRFLGIGVSGGILAHKNGYPLMVGGDKTAYEYITPILETLAKPHGGYTYLGTGGVGHFVKMVHNGIEYGMMQAIGEGFGVLEKGPYDIDLVRVAQIWQKGTIVAGLLMDCASMALEENPKLSGVIGSIAENGEARWTIEAAKKENVPVKVIEDSLQFRLDSQKDETVQSTFAAKMVASLRNVFGGHKIEKK